MKKYIKYIVIIIVSIIIGGVCGYKIYRDDNPANRLESKKRCYDTKYSSYDAGFALRSMITKNTCAFDYFLDNDEVMGKDVPNRIALQILYDDDFRDTPQFTYDDILNTDVGGLFGIDYKLKTIEGSGISYDEKGHRYNFSTDVYNKCRHFDRIKVADVKEDGNYTDITLNVIYYRDGKYYTSKDFSQEIGKEEYEKGSKYVFRFDKYIDEHDNYDYYFVSSKKVQ